MQKMPLDMTQQSEGVCVWQTAILPLPSKPHLESAEENHLAIIFNQHYLEWIVAFHFL